MLRKTFSFVALFLAASLVASAAQAIVYSLADGFSYAENSTTSTWSYGQEDNTTNPIGVNLYTGQLGADTMWGAFTPSSPVVWTSDPNEVGGIYWGIGKNTTGETVTDSGLSWGAGEVWFHPQGTYPVGRLDIVWTAPSDTTIVDADFLFASVTTTGNGVGLQLSKISGGVMTVYSGFTPGVTTIDQTAYAADPSVRISTPIDHSLTDWGLGGLNVLAGDKLLFQFDTWGDPTGDITSAAITITTTEVPEPSTIALLGAGLLGLLAYAWRKRK